MQRVKVSTGQVLSLVEIAQAENISLNPQGDPDLSFLGYERLTVTPMPTVIDSTVTPDGVEQVNGQWRTKWLVTPLTPAEVTEKKTYWIKKVDADVDQILKERVGERTSEYQRAEAQARAFKAGGYTGTAAKLVHDWAVIKGETDTWAADDIITQADAWLAAQDSIRENRLKAKEAMRVSTTSAALTTAINNWNTYLNFIRSALGL